jgi:hypothetical protein
MEYKDLPGFKEFKANKDLMEKKVKPDHKDLTDLQVNRVKKENVVPKVPWAQEGRQDNAGNLVHKEK